MNATLQKFDYPHSLVKEGRRMPVLPPYAKSQIGDGSEFKNAGWPGQPGLGSAAVLTDKVHKNLLWTLQLRLSGES